mgnify:CR=1 FL=1
MCKGKIIGIMLVITLMILSSCSIMPKRQVIDNFYISESPQLVVRFEKDIREHKKNAGWETFTFYSGIPIGIKIESNRNNANQIDYYYPLYKIMSNFHMYNMGSRYINDHEWGQFAYVNSHNKLIVGYFTRKDHYFIYVYTWESMTEEAIRSFEYYQKTLDISQSDKRYLQNLMEKINKQIEIVK